MIRLREIAKVTAGQAAPKEFADEGYPFIRAGHLEGLLSNLSLNDIPKVSEEVAQKKRLKKIPKGTIIFAKSGMSATKNRVYITEKESYFVSHLAGILPSEGFSNSYLARFLSWYKPSKLILDSAYPSIRLEDINNLSIPLPPLDQQKKIAAILDAADAYRQKTKALIEKYDALTQSLFLELFGDPVSNPMEWDKVALNELCDFKKTSVKPEEIETGDTYIGLECIEKQTGKILERFIVEAGEIKSNKFWFDSNYILYGKLRPYLNKVANPDFEGVCSTDIIPIRPILKNTVKEFIISLLRGSWFVSFADERCSGANLPRISPKEVEKYQTINPPLKLQNQFAERVQAIEAQKTQAQASLAQAEDLFNSLLQRAFKGELTS